MKTIIFAILIILISIACTASIPLRQACDQEMYDKLYHQIIVDSMKDDNYQLRNIRINALRKLCNGQKSSWERGLDVKGKHVITNR